MGGLPLRLLRGSGALFLAVLGACGGRTSALEPDAYGNQPTDGATNDAGTGAGGSKGGSTAAGGSTAKGGSTAAGGTAAASGSAATGGTTPVAGAAGKAGSGGTGAGVGTGGSAQAGAPSAGSAGSASGGATSVDPFGCTNYCSLFTQGPCPSGNSNDECTSSCVSELRSQTAQCQATASSLLSCLIAVYQNSNSCNQVDTLSLAKCSTLAQAYQGCIIVPPPPPDPPPPPPPLGCATASSNSGRMCSIDMKCRNGTYYSVYCYEFDKYQSTCTCQVNYPDGSASGSSIGLSEGSQFACQDALSSCGFPQP